MLILARKEHQRIFLGARAEIVLTVLKVENGVVRLGFDAPRDVPIFREEVERVEEFFTAWGKVA